MKIHLLISRLVIVFLFSLGMAPAIAQTTPPPGNNVTLIRYWAPSTGTGIAPQLLGQDSATITFLDGSGSVTYTATQVSGSGRQAGLNTFLSCADVTTTLDSSQTYSFSDSPPLSQVTADDGAESNNGSEGSSGATAGPAGVPPNLVYSGGDGTGAPTNQSMFSRKCPCVYSIVGGVDFNIYLGGITVSQAPLTYESPFGPAAGVQLNYDSDDGSALSQPHYTNMGGRAGR